MTVDERAAQMFELSFPRLGWWEQIDRVKDLWRERARNALAESDANGTHAEPNGSSDPE